jgi:hypothetical protein
MTKDEPMTRTKVTAKSDSTAEKPAMIDVTMSPASSFRDSGLIKVRGGELKAAQLCDGQ